MTAVSPQHASYRMLLLLAAMSMLDSMAIDLYASAFPTMETDFAVSANAIQATMSIFLIGAGAAQFVFGPLLDAWGRRIPILIGAVCFTMGSAVCAFAPGYEVFMLGRTLQSIGAASAMIAPRAVISDIYEVKDTARIFSFLMQIMMVAPIVSPVLGAFLLTHMGWRADFHALALVGAVVLVALALLLPETLPAGRRVPLRPSHMLAAYGRTVARRRFGLLMLGGGFVSGSLFAFLGASAFTFISGYGMTPIGYGLLTAAISIGLVVVGAVNIWLLRRVTELQITYCGLALQLGASTMLAAWVYWGVASLVSYAILCAVAVGALGLVFANITALAMASAGPNVGIASAVLGVGQSLLGASAGLLLTFTGTGGFGMMLAIAIYAALALLCVKGAVGAATRLEIKAEPTSSLG